MKEFSKYISKLPKPLGPNEQTRLFVEYGQTNNEQIRQTLIERNLRLAAQKAIDWAEKFEMTDRVFDINSECCYALAKAVDTFDPLKANSSKFAYFAHKWMDVYLLKMLEREEKHSQIYIKNVDNILANEKSEISQGIYGDIIEKFHDPETSRIAEDLAFAEFREEVLSVVSDENREIVKKSLGIGYPQKYTYAEIANDLPISRQRVGQIVDQELEKMRRHIATYYPEYASKMYQNYPSEGKHKKQFLDLLDKYRYITYSYYGIRGHAHKSSRELAVLFDTNSAYIAEIKNKYMERLSESEHAAILAEAKPKKKPYQDIAEQVFNDYYGINGKIYSVTEIQSRYKELPNASNTPVYNILNQVSAYKVASGQYTQEQMQEIKDSREDRKRLQSLDECAPLYYAHIGENGHDKQTQKQLAKKLQVTQESVSLKIKTYRDYLVSLSPAERQAEIARHKKQSPELE